MIDQFVIPHLWQSTQFAACIIVAAWGLRRNRAGVRYWLWFGASIKFLIPFAILTSLGRQVEPVAPPMPVTIAAAFEHATEPFSGETAFFATSAAAPIDWTPWVATLWACGAAVVLTARLRGWLRIRAMIRASRKTDLAVPVQARTAPGLIEPGIAGIWKPMLLLPEGIRDHLTQQQFDAIVAHELAHVRRRDNLLSLVHMVVETLFWFHPLVWWIGSRLMEERERVCDEAVIAEGKDPGDYAEAILNVCRRYVQSPLACVSGVTGADLRVRIEAIFRNPPLLLTGTRKLLIAAAVMAPVIVAFLAGLAMAQSRSFEVASIRLVNPNAAAPAQGKGKGGGGGPSFVFSNGRFSFSATTYALIMRAHEIPGFMAAMRGEERPYLTGGPDWIRKDRYSIQAILPEGTPNYPALQFFEGEATEVDAMLASLLRDRFGLRSHREMREVPVFTLNVVRGGHKMRATQAKMITWADGNERLERTFVFSPFNTEDGRAMFRLKVVNWSMAQAAQSFSDILDRPVIDRTGLSGAFDFDLEYAADIDNPGVRVELTGPELFTALQEQAGLRLESTRAPIEVVVIDNIERPSEN